MAVWRQPEGLGSGVPLAEEQNATAEETLEEVWAHRRGKAPLFERVRGGGAEHDINLFHCTQGLYRCWGASGAGYGW